MTNNKNKNTEKFELTLHFINQPSVALTSALVDEATVKAVFNLHRDSHATPIQLPLHNGSVLYLTKEILNSVALTHQLVVTDSQQEEQ